MEWWSDGVMEWWSGGEERLVTCGVSWERYLALDETLGDDRPVHAFTT
jgi:hypothetical protein